MQDNNAARLVSSAVLGLDFVAVLVADHRYIIHPPTIRRLAGAAYHLAPVADAKTLADLLDGQTDLIATCRALSWLIDGSEALAAELSDGTPEEVVNALKEAYTLISVQPFMTLSALARSVSGLTANPKQ